jgi:hypothetical protein
MQPGSGEIENLGKTASYALLNSSSEKIRIIIFQRVDQQPKRFSVYDLAPDN